MNACSNSKTLRYPKLYPEKTSSTSISSVTNVSPELKQPTLHIGDLILLDVDILRQGVTELIDTVDNDGNLSDNDDILLMAKVL